MNFRPGDTPEIIERVSEIERACEDLERRGLVIRDGVDAEGNNIWKLTEEGKKFAESLYKRPS